MSLVPLALDFLPSVLWDSAIGFTLMSTAFIAFIGGATGSLTIAFVAGYSMFSFVAINSNIALLSDVHLVTIVLIVLAFAFKLWKAEGASPA